MICSECSEEMWITDTGVSHHGAIDAIHHGLDADHVAIAEPIDFGHLAQRTDLALDIIDDDGDFDDARDQDPEVDAVFTKAVLAMRDLRDLLELKAVEIDETHTVQL